MQSISPHFLHSLPNLLLSYFRFLLFFFTSHLSFFLSFFFFLSFQPPIPPSFLRSFPLFISFLNLSCTSIHCFSFEAFFLRFFLFLFLLCSFSFSLILTYSFLLMLTYSLFLSDNYSFINSLLASLSYIHIFSCFFFFYIRKYIHTFSVFFPYLLFLFFCLFIYLFVCLFIYLFVFFFFLTSFSPNIYVLFYIICSQSSRDYVRAIYSLSSVFLRSFFFLFDLSYFTFSKLERLTHRTFFFLSTFYHIYKTFSLFSFHKKYK